MGPPPRLHRRIRTLSLAHPARSCSCPACILPSPTYRNLHVFIQRLRAHEVVHRRPPLPREQALRLRLDVVQGVQPVGVPLLHAPLGVGGGQRREAREGAHAGGCVEEEPVVEGPRGDGPGPGIARDPKHRVVLGEGEGGIGGGRRSGSQGAEAHQPGMTSSAARGCKHGRVALGYCWRSRMVGRYVQGPAHQLTCQCRLTSGASIVRYMHIGRPSHPSLHFLTFCLHVAADGRHTS